MDSTLLRFLSSQKRVREREGQSLNVDASDAEEGDAATGDDDDGSKDGAGSVLGTVDVRTARVTKVTTTDAAPLSSLSSYPADLPSDASALPPGRSTVDASNIAAIASATGRDDAPWLGQYNENSIARLLETLGCPDGAEAREAGRAVQRLILARTMRRRIRRFLRERDDMWAAEVGGGTIAYSPALSSLSSISPAASSPSAEVESANVDPLTNVGDGDAPFQDISRGGTSSGVEEILRALTEAGLTGRDAAAIFAHTPSVAVMRVRKGGGGDTNGRDIESPSLTGGGARATVGGADTLDGVLELVLNGLLSSTLKLRRYDARKVLRSCPGLLTPRGSRCAVQVVSLMSSLGVSASSLARDKSSLPTLLSRTPASVFRLAGFLAGGDIQMPVKSIGPFLRRRGGAELLDVVAPLVGDGDKGDPSSLSPTEEERDVALMEKFWGGGHSRHEGEGGRLIQNDDVHGPVSSPRYGGDGSGEGRVGVPRRPSPRRTVSDWTGGGVP